jgi:hypothetical protein
MTATEVLQERLLDCFPSGSYALSALLRLMDIVATTEIDTAAVECRAQPRLLLNPVFVEQHAATPEKLLMLVMHELHHVLLGHTRLFPTMTRAQNFVFDCVINALISRMFPRPEHLAFLTDYYSDAKWPECLLRPAADWQGGRASVPPGIATLPEAEQARAEALHRSLYSETGATYKEVFDMLPKLLVTNGLEGIPLLGDHDPEGATGGGLERTVPLLFDIVRGLVEDWPQPPDPIRGRSLADLVRERTTLIRRAPSKRHQLRTLIRALAAGGAPGRVREWADGAEGFWTPIPRHTRRSLVLQALGHPPLLHEATVPRRRRRPSIQPIHVYLDVSGSVANIRPALYGAILDCHGDVHPVVHLFSTRIVDVSLAELRAGVCRTTGGTDLGCVAEHLDTHRIRRALLVTDGWVGTPTPTNRERLSRVRLGVAYAGTSIHTRDLGDLATRSIQLKA